jgi:nucleotide-binding universal stress UspA family protein
MPDDPTTPARLLIAYDGSEAAAGAIHTAAQIIPSARATVAHVRNPPLALEHAALARIAVPDDVIAAAATQYEQAAQEHATELAERGRAIAAGAGLEATAQVCTGTTAWRALARAAQDAHADVIVCATRGQGPFSRSVLGSTSSSLLHHADTPILVVPPGGGDLGGPVLIGYDESDGARAAIALAARLVPGRPAIVVHAWSSPVQRSFAGSALLAVPLPELNEVARDLDGVFAGEAEDIAGAGAALAREHGVQARPWTVESPPGAWRGLSATAQSSGAALIVVGSRGRGAVGSAILGSVSAGLVHNADVPVLVVRAGGAPRGVSPTGPQ